LVPGGASRSLEHGGFHRHSGAESARKEFRAVTGGKPNNVTMAYHWARMIEFVALDREDPGSAQ